MTRSNELADSDVLNSGLNCLHRLGWVHGDINPGNIIVVKEVSDAGSSDAEPLDVEFAKLSDLEFAKKRRTDELERLTRTWDTLSPGTREDHTVGLPLASLRLELTYVRERCASYPLRSHFGTTRLSEVNLPTGSFFTIHFTTMNLSGGLRLGSSSTPGLRESLAMLRNKHGTSYMGTPLQYSSHQTYSRWLAGYYLEDSNLLAKSWWR